MPDLSRNSRVMSRVLATALCLAILTGAGPATARQDKAAAMVGTPAPASAQFYVLSFTDAPIVEVAEAVVGGGMALELAVDPAIDGTMSFQAEGTFTGEDLLRELGSATLDQDVALVRSRAGDLALVPRGNLAAELAGGGALVSLAPPVSVPGARTAPAPEATPIVYGGDRWWDGPVGGLLIFLSGAAAGAASLGAGFKIRAGRRRRRAAAVPTVMIAHLQSPATEPPREDPELTIPRFDDRFSRGG